MSGYVIGLTGGIACGKTNLSDALARAGARVIDADEVSRQLTAPGGAHSQPVMRGLFRREDAMCRPHLSVYFLFICSQYIPVI